MADRKTQLGRLEIGDFFHAEYPGQTVSLICLVVAVSETTIRARRITNQKYLEFDRRTGVERGEKRSLAVIDSVAPLPLEIHNVMLGLDRKSALGLQEKHLSGQEPWLNDAERNALIFVGEYYPANPLKEVKAEK